MKYLSGNCSEEVKDKRYIINSTENFIIRERKEPKSSRTQCQVIDDTPIRRKQEDIRNQNIELEVKYSRKKDESIIEKPKNALPSCPSFERNNWIELIKVIIAQIVNFLLRKNIKWIKKST